MIGKFQLKKMLYDAYDEVERTYGKVMSPGCEDEETGELRAEAMRKLQKAAEQIKEIADSIY